MTELPSEADVVIVGAGPAGLSAAAELRARGVARVLVLDRAAQAGGIPRICGHSPYGLREFRRLMLGPTYARALCDRAERSGARIVTGAAVVRVLAGPVLQVTTDAKGITDIRARAVLLATGTRETARPGRLIGGTKPGGVMVTGALQSLVYGGHRRPFLRPVILGTELVSFSAIATCRHAGIRPAAMIEPGARITARRPAGLFPFALGIPLMTETELVAIEGGPQVSAVVLRQAGRDQRLETDGVILSGRFRPEAHLARLSGLDIDPGTGGPVIDEGGRTSMGAVYAAGNLLRPVETAGWCWQEGRAIARVIAKDLFCPPQLAALPVHLEGDALKYVVPQRLSGSGARAFDRFQARVQRSCQGRFGVSLDGVEISARGLSGRPERRLTLPLPPVAKRPATVYIRERQ